MNFLDLLIALPLGYVVYKGYRRGLIFELASLASVVLGSFLAVRFARVVALLLPIEGDSTLLIAFFVIFVSVIILSLLLAKFIERFVKLVHVGIINNIGGALFGLVKALAIIGTLLYFVSIVDLEGRVLTKDVRESSLLYRPVERCGQKLAGKLDNYIEERKELHEQQQL